MQASEKQKTFSQCFAAFLKARLNFKYIGKNDDPIDFVIPKLDIPKA